MIKNKTVVICCAGEGKRLGKNIPKCLVDVCGKKVIERQLEQLKEIYNSTSWRITYTIKKIKNISVKVVINNVF